MGATGLLDSSQTAHQEDANQRCPEGSVSYVHALDGFRETVRSFIDYDAVRFMEVFEGGHRRPTSGLFGLLRDGEQYVSIIADHLKRAEPVYWSPEMCDMLVHVGLSIPDWTLRMSDLITDSGYAWFSKPLDLGLVHPVEGEGFHRVTVVGLLWGVVLFKTDESLGSTTKVAYLGDEDGAERWLVYHPVVMLDGTPRLCGGSSWAEGESLSGLVRDSSGDMQDHFNDWAMKISKCFASSMALMSQHIVTTDQVALDRTSRKRLAREGWTHEPIVRVVKLRRTATGGKTTDSNDEKAYELTCQFVVRGHWRNQFYPSTDERRPIFVLPYIKGPEGAPLRASADRVFEMVR